MKTKLIFMFACLSLLFTGCKLFDELTNSNYYIVIKVKFEYSNQGETEVYLDDDFVDNYDKNRTYVTLDDIEAGRHTIRLEITKSGTIAEFWVKWDDEDEFLNYNIERWNDLGAVSKGDTIRRSFTVD